MLKAGLDGHVSRCGIYGNEEWQQNKYAIIGTKWYFMHEYL
jgi:hypothetical protein